MEQIIKTKGFDARGISEKISSSYDGSLHPVSFSKLNIASRNILQQLSNVEFDGIIGLSGRGIIPSYAIAELCGKPLLVAYKNRLAPGLDYTEIIAEESHSSNKKLYIYLHKFHMLHRIILVDDEVTTGKTFINFSEKLGAEGVEVVAHVAFIENGKEARKNIESKGQRLVTYDKI